MWKIRFLVGVLISNSQKLIKWIYREVEGYNRPQKYYEPMQDNQDLYNFYTAVAYS